MNILLATSAISAVETISFQFGFFYYLKRKEYGQAFGLGIAGVGAFLLFWATL